MKKERKNKFIFGPEAKMSSAYPKKPGHLLNDMASVFGTKIPLQRVVDQNVDFLVQLQTDGLLRSRPNLARATQSARRQK